MPRRYLVSALLTCALTCTMLWRPIVAGALDHGGVLVPGPAWAGGYAALGDLNVYSNGTSLGTSEPGAYGGRYQCTELAKRWIAIRYGEPPDAHLGSAAEWWNSGGVQPVPLLQHPNGGADRPEFGDILVFGATSYDPTGHVSVVTGATATTVSLVEQNWTSTSGRASIPISGTYMPPRWGLPVLGWLRPTPPPYSPTSGGPGGYSVDGFGGLHPWGSAPYVAGSAYWSGWDIARGIVRQPGKHSGYVLDGFGGLHPFGGARNVAPSAYWGGWDIARGLTLRPDGVSGYVLDGFGGLHPFGGAPAVAVSAYWSGWDIARAVTLRDDGVSGWVLDGYGGLHPFGGAPAAATSAYWAGWDIATGAAVLPGTDTGYVVDGYGALHPFNDAPYLDTSVQFPGSRLARGLVLTDAAGNGEVGFANGAVATLGWADSVPADIPGMPINRGIA